eukprot:TRINITY_DN5595_c0_g3_i1.p1 TRINITY_DN5595_c0_g3~~TRINITY_DN5595_c0_g3_i1.p1  ORF type:complete len:293 (-),score=29.40 TRINITY_DN5595_c0_g3_i1:293-1171(-)
MTRHKDPKQSDRNVLLFNVLSDIRIVLNEARKQFTEVEELHSELSEGIMVASTMTNEVGLAIVSLFHEVPLLNQMIECRGDYMGLTCGSDSLLYFLGKLADVLSPQYKLIEEDILRVRIKTTGILEATFTWQEELFLLCDVGGQRSERRKWIHCFGSVAAIIYLVASNEYDMGIEEAYANSIEESLSQFKIITGTSFFQKMTFIVFFNKIDLLEKKLKRVPFSQAFSDYREDPNVSAVTNATQYLRKLYQASSTGRRVFFHNTCSLDRQVCHKVWESIVQSALDDALSTSGL